MLLHRSSVDENRRRVYRRWWGSIAVFIYSIGVRTYFYARINSNSNVGRHINPVCPTVQTFPTFMVLIMNGLCCREVVLILIVGSVGRRGRESTVR